MAETTETIETSTTTTETPEAGAVSVEIKTEAAETGGELSAADVAAVAATVADEIEKREAEAAAEAEEKARIESLQYSVDWLDQKINWLRDDVLSAIDELKIMVAPPVIETGDADDQGPASAAAEMVDNPATTILDAINSPTTKKGKAIL